MSQARHRHLQWAPTMGPCCLYALPWAVVEAWAQTILAGANGSPGHNSVGISHQLMHDFTGVEPTQYRVSRHGVKTITTRKIYP